MPVWIDVGEDARTKMLPRLLVRLGGSTPHEKADIDALPKVITTWCGSHDRLKDVAGLSCMPCYHPPRGDALLVY